MSESFVAAFRKRQVAWAESAGIGEEFREGEKRPWVLRPEQQHRNLFQPEWWGHIAGREHRWVRALTSSQCFAVNLFAPLIDSPAAARETYCTLYPDRPLGKGDTVEVMLEFTPEGTRTWLGEKGQPTQLDACFLISRSGQRVGYGLVEVKLTEQAFGACRGAKPDRSPRSNPDPERCRDLGRVLAAPQRECWLTGVEGRTYWELILSRPERYCPDVLDATAGCPFAGGFYQLMRNSVLALCLVTKGGAAWADAGVCLHPENMAVRRATAHSNGAPDIIAAFNAFALGQPVQEIDPVKLIETVAATGPGLVAWRRWMHERYFSGL